MKIVFGILIIVWAAGLPAQDARAGVTGAFSLGPDHVLPDRILIDQAGRKIRIKTPFTRIISLYGAHTENLFFLGLDREIIGVTKHDQYPEKAGTKPVFSYHDDPEKFLAADPDLVLIRPMIDRGYARLMRRLEKSGITVVSIQPGTIEEMYAYWRILGALSGREKESRRMVRQFKDAVHQFQILAEKVAHPKQVYFEAMHKNMKTFVNGSMADFVLKTAGGINVADDGTSSRGTNIAIYGKEKILSKAGDIDVFLAQKGAMNHPTVAMIRREPGFSVIKAVKNNHIHIVDEQVVSRPTMRLLMGIYEVGEILYPGEAEAAKRHILEKAFTSWTDQKDS